MIGLIRRLISECDLYFDHGDQLGLQKASYHTGARRFTSSATWNGGNGTYDA